MENNTFDTKLTTWLINNKPTKIYLNSKELKPIIYKENRKRTGIYLWLNNINGKYYIGSAIDLSRRLKSYYSPTYLKQMNNYISRAIIHYTHSAFSIMILEFIDITNLSKEDAYGLIQEQHYFETLQPKYNILIKAGSSQGYKHTEESKAKLSEAMKAENNPMFGKNHLPDILAKIREAR
jgi:group I intron endonuclease